MSYLGSDFQFPWFKTRMYSCKYPGKHCPGRRDSRHGYYCNIFAGDPEVVKDCDGSYPAVEYAEDGTVLTTHFTMGQVYATDCPECGTVISEHRVVFPEEMDESKWIICWTEEGYGSHGNWVKHFCIYREQNGMTEEEMLEISS